MTGNIEVKNLAENDGFSERLVARIASVGPDLTVVNGESPRVNPESGDASLSVTMSGLETAEIGDVTRTVNLNFFTDGGGIPATSGLPEAAAGTDAVSVTVRVQNPAREQVLKVSGPAFTYNQNTNIGGGDFATVESTDGTQTLVLKLQNSSPGSDPMDNLKATFDTSALAPFVLVPAVNYPADGLVRGDSRNFSVTLDPSALPAGAVSGTLVIQLVSSNPTSDLTLAPITLTFSATIVIPTPYEIWTDEFNLTGNDALPESDPDDDGNNNYKEFAFGGNPNSPASGPVIVSRVLEDTNGKFLAVLARVRKGDQSAFLPMDAPPFDQPKRAIRDGVEYLALGGTHPEALVPAFASLPGKRMLAVVPLAPPTGFNDIPAPSSPHYEDIVFRLTNNVSEEPTGFFRLKASPEEP